MNENFGAAFIGDQIMAWVQMRRVRDPNTPFYINGTFDILDTHNY